MVQKSWVNDKGWDFGISGSSPVIQLSEVFSDRPRLDFIGGVRKYKTNLLGLRIQSLERRFFNCLQDW
jgi:hypothetical protein